MVGVCDEEWGLVVVVRGRVPRREGLCFDNWIIIY